MRQLVESKRLIRPDDQFRVGFPQLDFREEYTFHTAGEAVLITDPTYLADVYNSHDEEASFLRAHGVFVMNFGGDVNCPVLYEHPYIFLPISNHLPDGEYDLPEGVSLISERCITDSGSFIFLPLTKTIPMSLQRIISEVITKENAVVVPLPPGQWTVYYEQWDMPSGEKYPTFYRNIVVGAAQ